MHINMCVCMYWYVIVCKCYTYSYTNTHIFIPLFQVSETAELCTCTHPTLHYSLLCIPASLWIFECKHTSEWPQTTATFSLKVTMRHTCISSPRTEHSLKNWIQYAAMHHPSFKRNIKAGFSKDISKLDRWHMFVCICICRTRKLCGPKHQRRLHIRQVMLVNKCFG